LHRMVFVLSALGSWIRFDKEIIVSMNGRQTEPEVHESVNR